MQQPNVIFVLTDDQGYPPVGRNGHPFIQTPNLDGFYDEATRFEQFHTGTTCAPTRAGLMTGHHCNSTGVWHTIGGRSLLRNNEWSLATALAENGYTTGLFGKWHLGDEYPYRPHDRGFQTAVYHGGGGVSQQPDWWGNDYFDDTYMVNGEPNRFEGYCTDVFFNEALSFMEKNKDRPFFCYISTNAPHSPFNVEPAYRDLYLGKHTDDEGYARFLGMVTNIDENFGRLREKLQSLDLEQNTVLIFMSDNGQAGRPDVNYNAGMRGMKGSPYEGGHRVPFFLRWPGGGIDQPQSVHALASYVDFMPTILDMCGVEVPEGRSFHGDSLLPIMRGSEDEYWRNRVTVTDTQRVPRPQKWRLSCVMKDKWRLVNRYELYDIEDDPGQEKDIAAEHPSLVSELREAYESWWQTCATQIDEEVPMSIGTKQGEETILRTHDLRSEGNPVWNQAQVRSGESCDGYWEVYAEQDGEYEFSVRRWPQEAGHGLTEGIEDTDVEFRRDGIHPGCEGWYSGGTAMSIDTVTLKISGLPRQEQAVEDGDDTEVFRVNLEKGYYHVSAYFSSADGTYTSAYYVHVRRI